MYWRYYSQGAPIRIPYQKLFCDFWIEVATQQIKFVKYLIFFTSSLKRWVY